MTPDEYITLAGKYCERMEWNHDAIPELAECLERHDKNITRFLEGEKIARQYAIDKGVELQRENTRLKRCEEAFKLMREYLIEQIIPEAERDEPVAGMLKYALENTQWWDWEIPKLPNARGQIRPAQNTDKL